MQITSNNNKTLRHNFTCFITRLEDQALYSQEQMSDAYYEEQDPKRSLFMF